MEAIAAVLQARSLSYEVIFIDDGSTDASFETLRALHEHYPSRVRAYRFNRNYGKSAALSVGIGKALGDIVITMDADLQDDPTAIPDMLQLIDQGWDLVSGWKKKRHDPLVFTVPSKCWNACMSIITGVKLHDLNCGFKAYRSNVAKSLEIYGERHRFRYRIILENSANQSTDLASFTRGFSIF
jgi:glycosyltransferase involved in cell wall biosynthesis